MYGLWWRFQFLLCLKVCWENCMSSMQSHAFLNYLKNGLFQLHLLVFGCDFVTYLFLGRREDFWIYILLRILGFYFLLPIITRSSFLRADTHVNQIFYFSRKCFFLYPAPFLHLVIGYFIAYSTFVDWNPLGEPFRIRPVDLPLQSPADLLRCCQLQCLLLKISKNYVFHPVFILPKQAKLFMTLLKLTLNRAMLCMWKYLVGIIAVQCSGGVCSGILFSSRWEGRMLWTSTCNLEMTSCHKRLAWKTN